MKILTKQIIYKTYLEKRQKQVTKHTRRHEHCKYMYIYQQELTNIFRLEKLQNSRAQDLQILRIYIEESAETSVEIKNTHTVYR